MGLSDHVERWLFVEIRGIRSRAEGHQQNEESSTHGCHAWSLSHRRLEFDADREAESPRELVVALAVRFAETCTFDVVHPFDRFLREGIEGFQTRRRACGVLGRSSGAID